MKQDPIEIGTVFLLFPLSSMIFFLFSFSHSSWEIIEIVLNYWEMGWNCRLAIHIEKCMPYSERKPIAFSSHTNRSLLHETTLKAESKTKTDFRWYKVCDRCCVTVSLFLAFLLHFNFIKKTFSFFSFPTDSIGLDGVWLIYLYISIRQMCKSQHTNARW